LQAKTRSGTRTSMIAEQFSPCPAKEFLQAHCLSHIADLERHLRTDRATSKRAFGVSRKVGKIKIKNCPSCSELHNHGLDFA
jgi:hypothetical protein